MNKSLSNSSSIVNFFKNFLEKTRENIVQQSIALKRALHVARSIYRFSLEDFSSRIDELYPKPSTIFGATVIEILRKISQNVFFLDWNEI